MPSDMIIDAQHITKKFVDDVSHELFDALHEVNIQAQPGKITTIIGPDGAGKTTFMRLVCGLLLPSGGELHVLGKDVTKEPQYIQSNVGYMPQKFGLYEDLSVQENMTLYADLHEYPKDKREDRFKKLLDMAGLAPFTSRLAGKLSGGMKQKLGLICTLISTPKLLLLDEPTVGVDPLSRRELWRMVQEMVEEEHITVLINTGYMDEAEKADYVYIINKGHVLASGTPDTLLSYAKDTSYLVTPPEGVHPRIIQSMLLDDPEHVIDAVPENNSVRCVVTSPEAVDQLTIKQTFEDIVIQPTEERLEDSFMTFLKKSEGSTEKGNKTSDAQSYKPTRPSAEVLISVKHLVRKFGDFIAVNDTTFDVHKGEIFGLLGPNGAGKSTTFKMLCGLLPITSGHISIAGNNIDTNRSDALRHIGYMAQKFSLYGNMSIRENLEFFGGTYGILPWDLKKRIPEVMAEFGLEGKGEAIAGNLPMGYKQRLSMAAALIHHPEILFLDEPTSGIDPLARRQFWKQITAIAGQGTTIIVTTHFMEEAEYCDRIMIQDAGRMIAIGTPNEIRRQGRSHSSINEAFIHIVEDERAQKVNS
jgi:ABC-2 type transport system ATP-binding protein